MALKYALHLDATWKEELKEELGAEYFKSLVQFLSKEEEEGQEIFPAAERVFAAFNLTPFDKVKVVIIGQDPYHGKGQANGLSFSVEKGIRIPPSLLNIFKELQADLGCTIPTHGQLDHWAEQGVLLLNATLTVRNATPASHQKKGWERFTDAVIRILNKNHEGLIFLLWGNFAQQKAAMIDTAKHFVLTAAHPSPLARTGFKGCRHFSQTNGLLQQMGKTPIDWQIR
jgi:uracil-DNA glycosylase